MNSLVLAERVGKKRSFLAGLLLSIATVGVYAIYWNYKAHNEIYKQFELAKENRDEGVAWYVLGLILLPFLVPYLWTVVSNVRYVRERMRLPQGITSARFITLISLGITAYLAASITFVVVETLYPSAPGAPATDLEILASELLLGAVVIVLVTAPYAYYRLQKDMNGIWDAYDRRIRELNSPAADPSGPPPPPTPPQAAQGPARYYADLPPRE